MLLKNLELGDKGADRMLVNGSRGVVVAMIPTQKFIEVPIPPPRRFPSPPLPLPSPHLPCMRPAVCCLVTVTPQC